MNLVTKIYAIMKAPRFAGRDSLVPDATREAANNHILHLAKQP